MVHIYVANISALPDPKEHPELLSNFPENRKQKILRFVQKKDRIQSLGASMLLQKVLQMYGKEMKDICYGENGKPELDGFYFNLSHSHEMAVCAVSECPVGCDIEKIGKPLSKIARRFFHENEIQYLESLDEEQQNDGFYRLWTMKESYVKMTGEGMKVPLNQVEFVLEDSVQVYRDEKKCACNIKEYDIPGYKVTVCAEEDVCAEVMEYIELIL